MEMISIAVINSDEEFVELLHERCPSEYSFERFSDEPLEFSTLSRALASSPAMVTVLGPLDNHDQLCKLVGEIDRSFPLTSIVAISGRTDKAAEIELFRAGAAEVVTVDSSPDQLVAALHEGGLRARRRTELPAPSIVEIPRRRIVVMCPKGGVGKTMIATNLAATLALSQPDDVAVVDLDLQFGDIAPALKLNASEGLASIDASRPVDVRRLSIAHHDCGLAALTAPRDLREAEAVTPSQIERALDALSAAYHYVVVDTAAGLDGTALAAVEKATDLLFVSTTNITSVRALKRLVEAFDTLGIVEQQRHLVINHANNRRGVQVDDVEQTIELKAIVGIPTSSGLARSANHGVLLSTVDPRDRAVRPLAELANSFLPDQLKRSPTRRWIR